MLKSLFRIGFVVGVMLFPFTAAAPFAEEWRTSCDSTSCALSTDIHHGPQSEDAHHLFIDVLVDRKTHNTRSFTFRVTETDGLERGLVIGFATNLQKDGRWRMVLDPNGTAVLSLSNCSRAVCEIRIPGGVVNQAEGPPIDLLQKFRSQGLVLFTYFSGQERLRASAVLSRFREALDRLPSQ